MKVMTITLNGVTITLRLTAAKLAEYAASIGSGGNTLFAVMDALDDLEKQIKLFTAALNYKGNGNTILDGSDLIDMLNDAEYDPIAKKQLIVDLAEKGGVIGAVDAAKIMAAIKTGSDKLYEAAVAVLSGDMSNLPTTPTQDAETQENPT